MAILSEQADQTELLDEVIPDDVLELCVQHGHRSHLQHAIHLARQYFKAIRSVALRVQQDPDEDRQRIIVDLSINGEIEEALASMHEFDKAWALSVPTADQDWIRLLFNFA